MWHAVASNEMTYYDAALQGLVRYVGMAFCSRVQYGEKGCCTTWLGTMQYNIMVVAEHYHHELAISPIPQYVFSEFIKNLQ